MPVAKLSSKGQLVIPKEVRDFLRVRAGDQIDFVVRDDGQVVIRPAVLDVRALRGLLSRSEDREPVPVEEMKRVIRERAGGR